MNIITVLMATLILLVVLLSAGVLLFLRRPLPQTQGTLRLPGLKRQAEVLRDRWGVPHIYAGTADDLFFCQGYVHAQDRLWQMDLQRRLGSGRLSEVFGEATLEVDRFFRVVGLNRAAEAEAETLDAETRGVLVSYAAGINAYIDAHQGRLPLEFGLLRFKPEPWRLVDSLYWAKVMAWNLSCNWSSELIRARLAARLGADQAADLEPSYPAQSPILVHGRGLREGADPPPNGWRSTALRDALRLVEKLSTAYPIPARGAVLPGLQQSSGGSNQWVVDGNRSATGRPLLANDTHLALQMPAGFYQNHLAGGDYNVSGVSLPGLPGVVVGHNEHCAWGMTTGWQDAQDLYAERLNPENPHQYEYQGAWQEAEVVREEIRVKGQKEPVVQTVVLTRHGPIISKVVGEEMPLALCWIGAEPGNLLGSALGYNRACNWQEFRAALDGWSTPGHNFVYADRDGNIGYLQAGWVPIRARGYGLAPVPGWTGAYEWIGFLSRDELPQAFNPDSGWLATSNQVVVDREYPHFLSADAENPCRARRAVELITSKPALSIEDYARFQLDTYSAQAERFVRQMLAVEAQGDDERQALAYLKGWDGHMDAGSVAASLYQVSRLRALHLVFDGHLGDLAGSYAGLDDVTPLRTTSPYHGRSIVRLLDMLEDPGDDAWLRDPASGQPRSRQSLLHQALREALDLLQGELGPQMSRWTWGRLNRVHFAHPVGSVKPLHLLFNRGPYPAGGDHDTLLRASGRPEFPFPAVLAGDALRFIADLSDWEKCCIVVPGGQSGHAASRHYADLIPLWREGRFQPMPFGREAVEAQAVRRLVLAPE